MFVPVRVRLDRASQTTVGLGAQSRAFPVHLEAVCLKHLNILIMFSQKNKKRKKMPIILQEDEPTIVTDLNFQNQASLLHCLHAKLCLSLSIKMGGMLAQLQKPE